MRDDSEDELVTIIADIERLAALDKAIKSLKENVFNGIVLKDKLCTGGFSTAEAVTIMYVLINRNCVQVIEPAISIDDYVLKMDRNQTANVFLETKNLIARAGMSNPLSTLESNSNTIELVGTVPITLKELLPNIMPASSSIAQIIASAKKEVWIVSPFFDEYAASLILTYINPASERGVRIFLITRGYGPDNFTRHPIDFFHNNLVCPEMVQARFVGSLKHSDIRYTIHSKIVLGDDNICYIGSANITEGGLKANFELGVVLQGDKAIDVASILRALWSVSQPLF